MSKPSWSTSRTNERSIAQLAQHVLLAASPLGCPHQKGGLRGEPFLTEGLVAKVNSYLEIVRKLFPSNQGLLRNGRTAKSQIPLRCWNRLPITGSYETACLFFHFKIPQKLLTFKPHLEYYLRLVRVSQNRL
jgi:hypothetical protein